ncbi:hypothetical protein BCL57_002252 [Agromyces flavus]|uniref:DUF4244 domain-containing protein n=1 Tax=Agromyces flavus TaxID=589382 RepID=A0A1H1V3U4_9MICO|nr:DUF4244 domain-containing protein [Agromyces flavus]MCP2368079.1 hypothetical protein [Agromyces flavus]GGI47540.1 hypothetical protein GCM10010932_22280 [Agromyces flavus]SDS79464.1 Protein of unknown function [Agromyces flavus]
MSSIPTTGDERAGGGIGQSGVRAAALARRRIRQIVERLAGERGAATAEYAVATMAAVGFAGLLVVILRGDEVRGILTDLVRNALTVG